MQQLAKLVHEPALVEVDVELTRGRFEARDLTLEPRLH